MRSRVRFIGFRPLSISLHGVNYIMMSFKLETLQEDLVGDQGLHVMSEVLDRRQIVHDIVPSTNQYKSAQSSTQGLLTHELQQVWGE